MEDRITVTSPLLPNLDEFHDLLNEVWASKWITNNGRFHQELEAALAQYLKVPYISLFSNGTLPLMVALQALNITGEVITTPYSFVATANAIIWNNCKPVFVDVDARTGNMDPKRIEEAITPRTTAILPVHVYGMPCDVDSIKKISDKYGLRIIYDAAHAFGVEVNGRGILNEGDLSTISFHATKVYNTIEGGALVMHDKQMKERVDSLKNFGLVDECTVMGPGINGKIDEVRAAYGLLNLKQVDHAIYIRHRIAELYRNTLRTIRGISFFEDIPGVRHNYIYFPIFINAEELGMSRDELFIKLNERGVLGRKYFYPLISSFAPYKDEPSANAEFLPNAEKMAESVICLPMHHLLSDNDVSRILNVITG